MIKNVIQLPVEMDLLEALNSLSTKEGRSRAEVIREACRLYLRRVGDKRLDRIHEEGYARVPEESTLGLVQASLTGEYRPTRTGSAARGGLVGQHSPTRRSPTGPLAVQKRSLPLRTSVTVATITRHHPGHPRRFDAG